MQKYILEKIQTIKIYNKFLYMRTYTYIARSL